MKRLAFFAFLLCVLPLSAADDLGALASLNALPAKYKDGVLKLSADNAAPNPDTWYVVAQSGNDDSNIHNLTLAGGQIVSDRRTIGLREIFGQASPVELAKIAIDSRDAFDIAQRYAKANGRMVGSVSFALQQKGGSSAPVWSVWCYSPDGSYLGLMQLLATDGTVLSNDAFPRRP
ncbi:MAG: hypothetical protein ACOYM3_10585 [Terrimicrobiaceae bacterium]